MIRYKAKEGGKIIRNHRGRGRIQASNGKWLRCSFQLVQYADASIRVFCPVSINDTGRLVPKEGLGLDLHLVNKASKFEGVTNDGFRVELSDYRVITRSLNSTSGKPVQIGFVLSPTHVALKRDLPESPSQVRFHVLNFDFLPIPDAKTLRPDGVEIEGSVLPLTCNGRELFFLYSDEVDVVKQLEATKGVDVTCQALAFLSAPEEAEAIETDLSTLCSVLSLVQGTRVNWASYDLMTTAGEVTSSHLQNATTRPFSSTTLVNRVDPAPFHQHYSGEYLKRVVEAMCPRFIELEDDWELRGLINTYNDAVSERDFLELRGLKVGGCMEILKARFLTLKGDVHIIQPHNKFEGVVPELKKRVLEDLKELIPDEDEDTLKMMTNHLQGANYYPFRRALRRLLQEINLKGKGANTKVEKKATEDAIGDFISIRDQLVHTGEFLIPTAPDSGWSEERILNARWSQMQFMGGFVGCVLVALLGWPETLTLPSPPDLYK